MNLTLADCRAAARYETGCMPPGGWHPGPSTFRPLVGGRGWRWSRLAVVEAGGGRGWRWSRLAVVEAGGGRGWRWSRLAVVEAVELKGRRLAATA